MGDVVEGDWLGPPSVKVPDDESPPPVTPPEAQPTTVPPSEVTDLGIPEVALDAYRSAAANMDEADSACQIDWSLIAGIGRVESDNGQFGGRRPGADGTVAPPSSVSPWTAVPVWR